VVRHNRISIKELKKLIFGAKTEKTRNLTKSKPTGKQDGASNQEPKEKPKGHGRNGTDAYPGAERVCLRCSKLRCGEHCPECGKGKLYTYAPSEVVCIRGQAPLDATIYEHERLCCNLCGALFTASAPPEATGPKYDASAASMMALLHYGCGFPFNRLDMLQNNLGIPLPSSTQWDVLNAKAREAHAIFDALNGHAATAEIFHNDDTKGARTGSGKADRRGDRSVPGPRQGMPHGRLHHRHRCQEQGPHRCALLHGTAACRGELKRSIQPTAGESAHADPDVRCAFAQRSAGI
jgi:transposase